ncbi:hypothetical protein V6N11_043153 [Hibiscus sabdariffa]|uniref:RNase H type-1 domain-containing protein n=1 Tax=Hibiscus sabdariffa TaxID=183260 RepID=A0ABR2QYF9_9ROSI
MLASWFKAKHAEVLVLVEDIPKNLITPIFFLAATQRSPPHVVWLTSPIGFLKLNVDGVTLRNGKVGGIGGFIRNSEGLTVTYFSEVCGLRTPLLAELEALKHGLKC